MTARVPRKPLVLLACVAGLLGATPVAQGAIVTVGSLRTDFLESTAAGSPGPITLANPVVSFGGTALAPVDGTILRWHVSGAIGGPFYLRVLRPSGVTYIGVGKSAAGLPASVATQTFDTSLPVRAGDLIGLDTTSKTDEIGAVASTTSVVSAWSPPAPEGVASFPTVTNPGVAELTFNAEMQPLPKVTKLSSASGSIGGGNSLTLSGSDFLGATAVTIGGKPAALFPVLSDSSLSVVVPKRSRPGAVDVTVTTPGGTSTPVKFTYVACRVPNLNGRTVKAAKKALRKANCKPGKVRGDGSKVVKQTLKAGTIRPAGAKVGLKKG